MKERLFPSEIKAKVSNAGIIAVIEINDIDKAVPVAESLLEGGITAIELALRTEVAWEALKRIAENVPEMMIGVGTVIKPGQAEMAKNLGASFGVSPGLNSQIVQEAMNCDFPFVPGIATPSELENAYDLGCDVLKFFPAEPTGGISYLKSLNSPFEYLNLSYIPLGGLSEKSIVEYASLPSVLAIGGSWIAKRDLIAQEAWGRITDHAKQAIQLWKNIRG